MGSTYFSKHTFQFLSDLKSNNDRAWFAANKARYEEHVKDPALRLIEDFAVHLQKLSPHFHAGPGALFRIHRDTRFSKDKSPYKTHTGIQFRHDMSRNVHAPGYYVHIEPGGVFVALGIWHPEPKALRAIREHVAGDGAAWKKASGAKAFREAYEQEGDRLTRPPKGFDPEHPLIEDLKWKDFIAVRRYPESFLTSASVPRDLAAAWKPGSAYMRFLCAAVGVPF